MHCREEARINARLAPNVYLGLMALQWDGRHFTLRHESALSDQAQTLDWLVLMRRLPHGRMLDRRIAAQSVSREEIDALSEVLSTFYRGAATSPIGSVEYLGRWSREHQTNRQVLERPRFRLPGATEALDRFEAALGRHRALLVRRVRAGRIVEGHGDLRPEHVCLLHPPVVIDALEFNPSMRQVDMLDELAFFGLECEMAGASWIGPRVVAACAKALDDEPPPALMALYTAGRALLRARLSMAHLLEPRPREPWRWEPQAARYLERARRALDALDVLGSMGNPGGSAREAPARPVPGRAPGAVVRAAPGAVGGRAPHRA